ncbi:MAG: glycerol-3-phosphate acyltransferase [Clostridiales bacterium]|nr:glycerol-3-phosphate acyltransferase [Clostridiales bacterium]
MSSIFSDNFIMALPGAGCPVWAILIAAVCAYFIGNINGAILLGKAHGVDVRKEGSGNAGTTNALRSIGKKAGAITFVIDVVKGWVVFFIASYVFMRIMLQTDGNMQKFVDSSTRYFAETQALTAGVTAVALLCGLCVVLGHMYPAVFGFRGGKGVATAFGVLLGANWLFALILLAVVLVFTAAFRRVSVSVLIAVAVALVLCFTQAGGIASGIDALWLVILLALVVWKHHGNIARLAKGTEPKLTFGSKK